MKTFSSARPELGCRKNSVLHDDPAIHDRFREFFAVLTNQQKGHARQFDWESGEIGVL